LGACGGDADKRRTLELEDKSVLEESCVALVRTRPALFHDLPELAGIRGDTWQEALAAAQVLSFPAGTKLVECGESADKFVIMLKGVVKVYEAGENGREMTLYRVYGGQVCVLTLTRLLNRAHRCAQAVAEQDVRLLAIPPEYFSCLMAESEDFRRYLMTSMAHCITDVMQLISQVSFNHLDLRLARLIRQLSDQTTPGNLRFTHQALANELGTTREVVSRLLKDFERAGYIKLSRCCIEIIDRDELEKLSH
jgi:CRP/FNR family transcriptional regulator